MKRSDMIDAVIRTAQPLNVLALPVPIWQGRKMRAAMPRLPAAQGPTTGTAPRQAPALRLTVLGDSAAAGVGAKRHADALAGHLGTEIARRTGQQVSWHVVARNAATTRDVVDRDLVPKMTYPTDLVVVVVGVNDLRSYRLICDFRRDTRALIDSIRRRTGPIPIILAGIPPLQHMPGLPRALRAILGLRARAMDDVLRRRARQTPNVRHVPLATQSRMAANFFTDDGFHLASSGHQLWAELIANTQAAHLERERQTGRRRRCPAAG
jgi:lysophospholipase L1-like esterase